MSGMNAEPSLGRRVRLYLYGMPNIVGCLLALGGLGLFFAGVIADYWGAIVLGLYVAGAIGWPRSQLAETAAHTELAADTLAQQLSRLVTEVGKGLPKEAVAVLRSIEGTLRELLPRLQEMQQRGSVTPQSAFTVAQTVRRYLPDTLAGYLKLPAMYARMQKLPSGKTAAQTLVEQLHLLDESLQKIAHDAFAGDAEALLVNGEFLKSKFSQTLAFQA